MRWPSLLALALCVGAAAQPVVPANDGWVTDLGEVLTTQQEAELEHLMASYQAGSKHDIALLTVRDLGGRGIEELAIAAARQWRLGQREIHDGALLVMAVAERRLRIEVGRGLEGVLPDALCGRIIRNEIAPHLRERRYYEGLRAGLLAMHAAAGGAYADSSKTVEDPPAGGLLFMVVLFVVVMLLARRHNRGAGAWIGPALPGTWSTGRGGFSHGQGGGFGGFGGGGGFSGGGASGSW